MARYRAKDETDLAWNRIRRRITRELDTEIYNAREEMLNDLLMKAWDDYAQALGEGKVPEVESKYAKLVTDILTDEVPRIMEKVSIDSPSVGQR
jgi:RES domain-containing protein